MKHVTLWAVFDWWHRHLTCIDLSSMGGMTLWSRQLSDASGSIQAEVPPASASASTLPFISFLLGSLVDPCAIGSKWTYWVGCKSKMEIRKLWGRHRYRLYHAMHKGRVWSRNSFRQGPGEIPSWLTLGTVQLKSVSCRKWSSSQRACSCLPVCTHTNP